MADTGWLTAGTVENMTGIGTIVWASPSNASTNNSVEASANINHNEISNWLRWKNFTIGIPAGATIDGYEVKYERRGQSAVYAFADNQLKLVDHTGSVVGNDKAAGSTWSASVETITAGGAADKWGTSLTESNVNDIDFGFALSIKRTSATVPAKVQGFVDYAQIKIYYTESAGNVFMPKMIMY